MPQMIDPSSEGKSFSYDSLGRVTEAIDENGNPITNNDYHYAE